MRPQGGGSGEPWFIWTWERVDQTLLLGSSLRETGSAVGKQNNWWFRICICKVASLGGFINGAADTHRALINNGTSVSFLDFLCIINVPVPSNNSLLRRLRVPILPQHKASVIFLLSGAMFATFKYNDRTHDHEYISRSDNPSSTSNNEYTRTACDLCRARKASSKPVLPASHRQRFVCTPVLTCLLVVKMQR